MIGISDHPRRLRVMSMPSPSGSTRSMIAASGGRNAATSSASSTLAACSTSKPASRKKIRSARRICGSSSTTRIRGIGRRYVRRRQDLVKIAALHIKIPLRAFGGRYGEPSTEAVFGVVSLIFCR